MIMGLSYVMVDCAVRMGKILKIKEFIMGLLVLSAGTSIPDTLSSIAVAKQGEGDMAVSNAIGSNVFDILLGLGLPWSLSCVVYGTTVPVDAANLEPMSIILFTPLAAVYGVTVFSG